MYDKQIFPLPIRHITYSQNSDSNSIILLKSSRWQTMLETLSLLVWSLLQVLKKAKRANCVFALTDGLTSLEIVSFCGLKIRAVFLLSWAQNRSYIFAIEFQWRAESGYNSFARKCMTIAWQVAGCFSKRKFKRCENIAVWQKMQINNVISFRPTIRSVNTSVN